MATIKEKKNKSFKKKSSRPPKIDSYPNFLDALEPNSCNQRFDAYLYTYDEPSWHHDAS